MIQQYDLEYYSENTELFSKYHDLVLQIDNNIIQNTTLVFPNKLGSINFKCNHYHYNIKKDPLDFINIQKIFPKIFSILSSVEPDKKIVYDWMAFIGYKDHTNFLGEHIHRPPIEWIGIYYLDDRSHGTEIWDDEREKWITLQNKNSRLYIIRSDIVHRFYMRQGDTSRIMMSMNFHFE